MSTLKIESATSSYMGICDLGKCLLKACELGPHLIEPTGSKAWLELFLSCGRALEKDLKTPLPTLSVIFPGLNSVSSILCHTQLSR